MSSMDRLTRLGLAHLIDRPDELKTALVERLKKYQEAPANAESGYGYSFSMAPELGALIDSLARIEGMTATVKLKYNPDEPSKFTIVPTKRTSIPIVADGATRELLAGLAAEKGGEVTVKAKVVESHGNKVFQIAERSAQNADC